MLEIMHFNLLVAKSTSITVRLQVMGAAGTTNTN